MTRSEWTQYTPHALVATAVFAFMHVGDEIAGRWDAGAAGQPMGDPMSASLSLGVFTIVGMGALWLILTERPWGYVLAGLFGLMFLVTGGMHFLNTGDMTVYRWIVVVLEVVSAAALLGLSLVAIKIHKPWRRRRATEA